MIYIFLVLSLVLITFLISEYIFVPTNLYYELFWLDIVMHIWGGFLISLLFIKIFNLKLKRKIKILEIIIFIFIISMFWELLEYLRGQVDYNILSDYYDTLYDFINAFLGGIIAYKLCQK